MQLYLVNDYTYPVISSIVNKSQKWCLSQYYSIDYRRIKHAIVHVTGIIYLETGAVL